ncbi:(2Fe-2S)-binding protein [Phytoactinopolyspora limicola]|uniref:(2Fe-2S)-binding protein n=1 Tax=Phytoactinopolyspora limicola TaxID=2715536 RepID=UPI001408E32F|nr:(2Fe-2S)-binding protein [Phytoactinopolyspora limicola]
MATTRQIDCTVNGEPVTATVETRLTLADFLRDQLTLTGTHLGCEHGVCGACTVHVDGAAVRGCLMLAVQVDGSAVRTVEGLSDGDALSPLQQAFRENHALQCGFCTPGVLMSMQSFLDEHTNPTANDVTEALSGNLCRCTGYAAVVAATLQTARDGVEHHDQSPTSGGNGS